MLHCRPLLRFVKFELILHLVDFFPNPILSDFKINIQSKVNFLIESTPLVSELCDAEVVEFLPLFAFHTMKCDKEPAKLCMQFA